MKNLILGLILTIIVGPLFGQSYTKSTTYSPYNVTTTVTRSTVGIEWINVPAPDLTQTVYVTRPAVSESFYYGENKMLAAPSEIKLTFVGIIVAQLDPNTDTLVGGWETTNYCTYTINKQRNKISYVEKTSKGVITKTWEYTITVFGEDDKVYRMEVDKGGGQYFEIAVWKDKSMVALIGNDYVYLITGYTQSK